MSANTGRAPRSTYALTVDTKVNDGTMTSSPGARASKRPLISSACVHDVVSSARLAPISRSSSCSARRQNGPSPAILPLRTACATSSAPAASRVGRLNGIMAAFAGDAARSLDIPSTGRP